MKKLIQTLIKMHLRVLYFIWFVLLAFSSLVFLNDAEMNTVFCFVFILYNFIMMYLLTLGGVHSKEKSIFYCLPIRKKDIVLSDYCLGAGLYLINCGIVILPNIFSVILLGMQWIVPLEMLCLGWGIQAVIIVCLDYVAKKDNSKIVYTAGLFVVIIGLQKLDGFQHITWPVAIGAAVLGSLVFAVSLISDLRRVDHA